MTAPQTAIRPNPTWNARSIRRLKLEGAPIWGGAAAATVGIVVLLAWVLSYDAIKSVFPGLPTMKVNTAISFVLIGLGVVLLSKAAVARRGRSIGVVLIVIAVGIALLTGAQYMTGLDLGIDQLLIRDHGTLTATASAPGRMSPLTAICFIMLGVAALAGSRAPRIVIGLSGVSLAVAVLNVLTFALAAAVPPVLADYTQMALNSAVVIGILALGVIGLLGTASPLALIAGPSPTARLFRELLAVSLTVPVGVLGLTLLGQRLGFFDPKYGVALTLLAILFIGTIAVLRSAGWAHHLDAKRAALEIERDRFFELSLDMLSVVDADGRFERVNAAWETSLGYRMDQLVGHSAIDLIHPDDLERTIAEARRLHEPGDQVDVIQSRLRHADGSYRWLEWVSQAASPGSVSFAVARDVTERKRKEARRANRQMNLEARNDALSERATRDPLTGLHNRRYFDQAVSRLERRWARRPLDPRPTVSVVLFDLDHFGQVNKDHGHQAGDVALRVFSGLLRKRFREKDLVTRYGGEEFVALLEGATASEAIKIAEDLRAAFERASIDIGARVPIQLTVSAGCAQVGDDLKISTALSLADVWLSQAKRAGRNQVVGL